MLPSSSLFRGSGCSGKSDVSLRVRQELSSNFTRIVAIVLGFGGILLFFFVPETFWDRTPRAKQPHRHISFSRLHLPHLLHHTASNFSAKHQLHNTADGAGDRASQPSSPHMQLKLPTHKKRGGDHHVAFDQTPAEKPSSSHAEQSGSPRPDLPKLNIPTASGMSTPKHASAVGTPLSTWKSPTDWDIVDETLPSKGITPDLHNLNSPWYAEKASENTDYFAMSMDQSVGPPTADAQKAAESQAQSPAPESLPSTPAPVLKLPGMKRKSKSDKSPSVPASKPASVTASRTVSPERSESRSVSIKDHSSKVSLPPVQSPAPTIHTEKSAIGGDEKDSEAGPALPAGMKYTEHYRAAPPKTYKDTLKPYHGRLSHDNWLHVAARPFVLFLYPSILWSAMVYSLSVGWLIVLSESVSLVYKNSESYNFSSIQTGLVYLSPFIGGILGTAVAGKVSDVIVRFMARRNDGVYEPEFRLVMAIPIAITSVIGLMGFGWSAEERDHYMIPTVMFGIISFGCSLGSTTAITFAVDSYRQYAGEALVTLNFSKSESIPTIPKIGLTLTITNRHLPRPRLLPLLPFVAGARRLKRRLRRHRRHPAGLHVLHHPHVHLRQACSYVDGAEELDGEVLIGWIVGSIVRLDLHA